MLTGGLGFRFQLLGGRVYKGLGFRFLVSVFSLYVLAFN